ncbi:putative thymidylate synthase [Edwardsiella phage ETP-1]|uniref:thymidylate synthase n=3 Tax=Kafunavirus KF1 TaxID=1982588 RepID=A0A6G5P4D4_9CAUD|nr:putative thymidylate synthase [Edwardsiella phage KF-1]QBP07023.1 putative thymidylate synthase [Edwardsiella phage ETP-1]BAM63073.1 putative thymidylate synthase [Edwardsiella phage KF-1]BAM63122.1 putative thymidylate synthase [Edwardsiella phage IW-1]
MKFEHDYAALVSKILRTGEMRNTRNAVTKSIFGETLVIDCGAKFAPLLVGRQMFYKGIFGELAAVLRQPKHIDDFKRWGCNYWGQWANSDGTINVDYGNAWFRGGQIERLKDKLANDPTDRRMIIAGWEPKNLDKLNLPCCHHTYQFYVRAGKFLDMSWSQRSVDTMIGLPSDIVFAWAWLVMVANEFGFTPGRITMFLGDCHIYEEHIENAQRYLYRVHSGKLPSPPTFEVKAEEKKDFTLFEPDDIMISSYEHKGKLEFKLYE